MRSEQPASERHPAVALLVDVREGFVYMVRTPWLLGTLVFASLLTLLIMGPFEVLVPFVIKDVAGGGPEEHALILAAFGIGGAVGSAVIASLRMPRRYLTVMNLLWGLGCLPLAVFGLSDQIWVMAIVAFAVGAAFNGGVVIWGTLLQRRVPASMLGRVSSLDFFVSLAFMPVSMAVAGPAGESLGLPVVFVIAGVAPFVIGVVAIIAARMTRDEVAHPLGYRERISRLVRMGSVQVAVSVSANGPPCHDVGGAFYQMPRLDARAMLWVRFHDLRHTYASLMLAAEPWQVSQWMEHANVSTTDAIYAPCTRAATLRRPSVPRRSSPGGRPHLGPLTRVGSTP